MNHRHLCLSSMSLCITLFVLTLTATPAAQSASQSKPKKEKFGSSLKRLKWDPKRRVAIEKSDANHRDAQAEEGIKLQTLMVSLEGLVMDGKTSRFIRGLTKEDFMLTEDGQPQRIDELTLGDAVSRPRSIILIIDYSGSQDPYLETSIAAAKVLVSQLAPQDQMAIVTDDVELLIEFTPDKWRLQGALDDLKKRWKSGRHGKSCQFTALYATLRELVDPERRCLIIFQTDGDQLYALRDQPTAESQFDEYGMAEFGLGDIYDLAEKSSATIYTVITNGRLIDLSPDETHEAARKALERKRRSYYKNEADYQKDTVKHPLSEPLIQWLIKVRRPPQIAAARAAYLTGGLTGFLDEPEQAAEIYSHILADINNRYILSYYPTNPKHDGSRHKLRFEIRGHPDYIVHSRKTYLAPNDSSAHLQ